MANFFKDNEDLRFYFEKGLDWDTIAELSELGFRRDDGHKDAAEARAFYRDVAEMVGDLVGNEIAPHAAEIDREGVELIDGEGVSGPRQQEIFRKIAELDLHALCLPRELGGLNAPLILYFIVTELMARADVSVMAHHSFHGGIAMALLVYSIREGSTEFDLERGRIAKTRFEEEIREIAAGKAWGSMDITEAHAGSDMAQLNTVGEQDDAGNWFVTGQKIFITSGHGKYHVVIARTEKQRGADDPFAGLNGLSTFLVPAYAEDADGARRRVVTIDRLEEKLGHHGSATAAVSFDRAPAHLIGKRGEGFKHMLTLMNGARIGVGFECIGLCEAAYRAAVEYAAERRSMGKPIARHEMIADYLDEMRTDVQALRALAMEACFHEEIATKREIFQQHAERLGVDAVENERLIRRHRQKARRITPLLKYLAAEKSVEMSRRCVQIHGGNGYTKDYPGEKLLRDSMVMPIYEGTSQIQSLMAMRDALTGILKNPQRFVRKTAEARWRSLSARSPLEKRAAKIQLLALGAQQHLLAKTAGDKLKSLQDRPLSDWPTQFFREWDPKRDFAYAMLHAERLTRLLADAMVCEILLKQARKFSERAEVLERFLDRAEPRARFLHDEITTTGGRVLAQLAHEGVAEPSAAE